MTRPITATQEPVKPPPPPRAPLRLLSAIGAQNLSLVGALALVVVIFTYLKSGYLTWSNIQVIGVAVSVVGLLSIVQTIVIICGALDISVGSQATIGSVISAMVFMSTGHSALLGMAAAIGVGIVAGFVNGVIIVYGRVNPIIATLATLAAYKGFAQIVSNGRAQGYVLNDSIFVFIARGKFIGIPAQVWILIVVAIAAHLLLKHTDIGRNIYAIGGNDTAARLAGININKYLLAVYVMVGIVSAVAGIILTAYSGFGDPTIANTSLELKAITAAALGGCALKGGKGGIGGTLLAVLLIGALSSGLDITGVNSFWQNVAQGAMLAAAVIIQQRRNRERAVGLPT